MFKIEAPGPDKITWLSDIRSRKRAKSYVRKIEQYCRDHFIPKFGDKNMLEIDTMDIAKFRKYIVEDYRTKAGKPLSEKAVKNVMDQLRAFCNWLHKMKRDFQIPIFDAVSVPEKIVRTMPIEDREKAFAAITSPRLRAIIDLLIKHLYGPQRLAP